MLSAVDVYGNSQSGKMIANSQQARVCFYVDGRPVRCITSASRRYV